VAAFTLEQNSVVRAMLQRIASAWLGSGVTEALRGRLEPLRTHKIELKTEDARRALLQQRADYGAGGRVLLAFRRAMVQGDRMWPAAVGGLLALGSVRHEPSFSYIHRMATSSRHPEIRAAYALVQPFTGLPPLPSR